MSPVPGPTVLKRVNTDASIECPVCGLYVELKLTFSASIESPINKDQPYRVFVALLSKEAFNLHTCWPKEDDNA